MKNLLFVVKNGALKGLKTTLMLLKIVIPVYLAVVFAGHTGLYLWLAGKVEPAMRLFALPGDAVVPVITGIFADEYGAVAAAGAFSLTGAQLTIIAMIILCFHSVPVESVIAQKIGLQAWKTALFRFGLAVATGIAVAYLAAFFLGGDAPSLLPAAEASGDASGAGVDPANALRFDFAWGAILPEMGYGALRTVLTIMRVVIPMMIVIEVMLAYNIVVFIAKKLTPVCRLLGISRDALLPLLVGLLLGVTYGAGVIVELNRSKQLPPRDIKLIGVFLFSCHGIIETSWLFSVAGANIIFISAVRLAIAVAVTAAAARLPAGAKDS